MRIALLHYSAPPVIGGVERVLGEQAEALRGMGHEVEIVVAKELSRPPVQAPCSSSQTIDGHQQGAGTLLSPRQGDTPVPSKENSPFYSPLADTQKHTERLPHWTQDGVYYFLTWRLADAIPAEKARHLRLERDAFLKATPKPWSEAHEREFHERFTQPYEALMDAGHGSCLLRKRDNASIVESSMRHEDGQHYKLHSFVIMPNHVHALVWLQHGQDLDKVVKSWKGITARRINTLEKREGMLWQADYYDRMVRDESHLHALRRYIQRNPEKAKLREGEFKMWSRDAGFWEQSLEGTRVSPHLGDKSVPAPCALHRWEKLREYDLIIVHNVFTMPFDLPATRALRELAASTHPQTRWINWVHDVAAINPNYAHLPWDSSEDLALLKTAPPHCTHVAVSEVRQREYCTLTNLTPNQCRVIPNGIDTAKILNLSPRIAALIPALNLWERRLVLVHPTRILRRKNIELGLRIVDSLRQQHSQDIAYLITGAPDPHNPDGAAYGNELRTLVAEHGLQDNAFFLGEAGPLSDDDVRSLYAMGDALLFPSKTEGFGLPVVEAALHGLPVFCSDIPAHREVGHDVATFFDLQADPATIASTIAQAAGVKTRSIRRTALAESLDWNKITVTYLKPLLNDVANP